MNDYDVDLRRYREWNLSITPEQARYRRETPLTKAIALFRQEFGKAPNQKEMTMLIYQLGGTTVKPSEITWGGEVSTYPHPYGRTREDLTPINNKIIEIVESVARQYGWQPEIVPTTEFGVRRDVLRQTPTEFLDAQYTTSGLFPAFSPFMVVDEGEALSAIRGEAGEFGTEVGGRGDILYEDFVAAIRSVNGEKPVQPGVVDSIRYWFWNVHEGRKFNTFADIQNSVRDLFLSANSVVPRAIVEKAITEKDEVDKIKEDSLRAAQGSPMHLVTLKTATSGDTHAKEHSNELVQEYHRRYGVGEGLTYTSETNLLNIVATDPGSVATTWNTRDQIPDRVYAVLLAKDIDISKLGEVGNARLESAISIAFSNLRQAGAIPHTAIESVLSGPLWGKLMNYVKGMAILDPRYGAMSERMAVDSLLGGEGGLAEQIRDFEQERFFGWGKEVNNQLDELIARAAADDPTGVHAEAIDHMKNIRINLIDDILMDYKHHQKVQQMYQDSATDLGEPYKIEPFDFDLAVNDAFKQAWIPIKEASIASVAADQQKIDTQKEKDTRAARDIANALASQQTTGAFAAYRDAAWRAWSAQGKNPDDFNIDLMERFTNNGKDPSLAALSLSRELFDAQTADGVSLPSNVKIFDDFVKLREQQTMQADTAKLLHQFPTVEAAIASPIGRAALEKLAPGLTGEDEAEIASLEELLAKVRADPTGAHEGYKSKGHDMYTEEEIEIRIGGIRGRPTERFQQQLAERAKGMPLPNLEAMFGYDTGGVDVSQEAWFNAFLAKEKELWTWDDQAFLAGIPEEDKEDVVELLGKEGGLARLQGMFDAGFSIPDAAYYAEVDAAREAAGLVDTEGHRRGVGTEKEIPYWDTEEQKWKLRAESVEDWQERVGGAIDPKEQPSEPYVDYYPEYTEPGTYQVDDKTTLTIPEGGKIPQPEPREEAPGEYSRRTLFAQSEHFASMRSVRRQKLASDQTFQQFVVGALPAELARFRKERAVEAAAFTGGRARRTSMAGGRRVRF